MAKLVSLEDVRKNLIEEIISDYDFVKHTVIGKSLCSRNIDCLQIGTNKNMVLWVGAFHGMEWLTSFLILKFLKNFCFNMEYSKEIFGINMKDKLSERGLCIVPCLNPDGVEISTQGCESAGEYKKSVIEVSKGNTSDWQANARGVDLNHNYDAGWIELHSLEIENGVTGPSKTRYGGKFPESEPETISLVNLCKKSNFEHAIAFHSQGEVLYWKYGDKIPEKSEIMARIFALSSGYKLSSPEGLAVGGGFKDWFILEFNKPAFTVEIGRGKNPLVFSKLDSIYKKVESMMYISALM